MNKTNSDRRTKQFCKTVIAKRLGDTSTLPKRLTKHVVQVYADFIAAYLNVLRQKEGKPQDWFPDSLSIDPALEDEMRHFFSDYQHITNAFRTLNKKMDELFKIDRDKQPNLYKHAVTSILILEHR